MMTNSDKKKVLIVCYAFPPYPGIGGRRWAKFAKYLEQSDVDVKVISSENPFSTTSNWVKDTQAIKTKQLKLNYPKALITYPGGLIGRLTYFMSLQLVKLFGKGNYYDRTIFWRNQLQAELNAVLTREKLDAVIVTAAPFRLLEHCSFIKAKWPHVKLIADLRDPWTNNLTSYGFESMSAKRLAYEKNLEKSVFHKYDKVFTVSDFLTSYYQNMYQGSHDKFETLMNGFDPEECDKDNVHLPDIDESKINLVFTGSFYQKSIHHFKNLLDTLLANHLTNLKFYFYGKDLTVIKNMVSESLQNQFQFGEFYKITEVNALIDKSDYGMLFLTDDINYSLSTKFCEYIKFDKKILVFSNEGFTGDYVEKQGLGWKINAGNIKTLLEMLNNQGKQLTTFPIEFQKEQFSIMTLTGQIFQAIHEVPEIKDATIEV